MERKNNGKIKLNLWTVLLSLLCFGVLANAADAMEYKARLITNPAYTHFEKDYKPLKVVRTISENFSKQHFIAFPSALAVDAQGNIFVFDRMLYKVFVFDKNGTFLRVFGKEGRGPGDIAKGCGAFSKKKLALSPDNHLLISDCINKKILEFDIGGTLIHEYPIGIIIPFPPVLDRKGNIYMPAESMLNNDLIYVYDSNLKKTHTLLKKSDYMGFLNLEPKKWILRGLYSPHEDHFSYDLTAGGELAVYIANTCTFCLFKDFKLIKKFNIYPKNAMELLYRQILEHNEQMKKEFTSAELEEMDKHSFVYDRPFLRFFLDKDNDDCFYLQGDTEILKAIKKKRTVLYKFKMDGKLENVLYIETKAFIHVIAKRNNLFYGTDTGGVVLILKEK
ncbi:MAG: 6-bladed beta-propeller [bacterium]|nr:6-bladed beta-propeller [bacterium]